jgi:hypothetical protein
MCNHVTHLNGVPKKELSPVILNRRACRGNSEGVVGVFVRTDTD